MVRLNSGIFWNFDPRKWNFNPNSSNCRALKIILNDTKVESIPWELNNENSLLNSCVGVWVGGHHRANFSYRVKMMVSIIYLGRIYPKKDFFITLGCLSRKSISHQPNHWYKNMSWNIDFHFIYSKMDSKTLWRWWHTVYSRMYMIMIMPVVVILAHLLHGG